ncbi:MAG TPA: hypothetical protein VGP47_11825 [Parachlamydiaceae bacterium]|nr:hypothetical protein [Parachlamydiaceae bacterium]
MLGADLFHELALIEEAERQDATALPLKTLCLYLYTIAGAATTGLLHHENPIKSSRFLAINSLSFCP